jgi:hypothetical protein
LNVEKVKDLLIDKKYCYRCQFFLLTNKQKVMCAIHRREFKDLKPDDLFKIGCSDV